MAESPPENKPSRAMDEAAREFMEKMLAKEFGIEHYDEDDAPRPIT
jgi:hypothetical protein